MNRPVLDSCTINNRYFLLLLFLLVFLLGCGGEQQADPEFDTAVTNPAYRSAPPKILFDEAHHNIHKAGGTYKPFVDVVSHDGYVVVRNESKFTAGSLQGYDILVISNAKGEKHKYDPAFSEQECDAVEQWVQKGGNLLLIADHYPLGSAAEILSKRFGVEMSKGFTNDPLNYDTSSYTSSRLDGKSQIIYTWDNGSLRSHPITEGRSAEERVHRIITFTGQSLKPPANGTIFLALSDSAADQIPDSIWEEKEWLFFSNTVTRFSEPASAAGRGQGVALEFGQGRVVVLGEAAMLTAQVYETERFGMNVMKNDNKKLALNIMHWLSRLI